MKRMSGVPTTTHLETADGLLNHTPMNLPATDAQHPRQTVVPPDRWSCSRK